MDDEATVIAGLYRTEASEVRRGVPTLKDLPGWFFRLQYILGYNSKYYPVNDSEKTYKFYVVANSFTDKANAEAYFNMLSQKDYEPQLLRKANSGRYVVAYSGSNSWRGSKSLYDSLRSGGKRSVWVYQHR